MRIVATTICVLMLAGCASSNLPYSIAIGDPSTGRVGQDEKHCVLRLDDIVKHMADKYTTSALTVRSLQMEFEKELHEQTTSETKGLVNCTDDNGRPLQKTDYPLLEEVAKKWLSSYALDATDPDQTLDRFREYLRSAQLVRDLARSQQLLPDEDARNTYLLVENIRNRQSQWCGSLTAQVSEPILPPLFSPAQTDPGQRQQTQARTEGGETDAATGSPCIKERSLYHIQAVLTAPDHKGKTDLYEHLLDDIVQIEMAGTQRNQRYFVLGYEIPWDKERTLVRYGVAFYFKQAASEKAVELIGYDLTYANEATPEPRIIKPSKAEPSPWQKNPWAVTGYPFSLVIGLKNAAFEIAKLPFSTIAGLLFGRDVYNYPIENLQSAWNALSVEATTQTHRGAEWGLYRLLTEVPLVGQLFQYNLGLE